MMLTNHRERMELWDAVGDSLPRLPEVFGYINVGIEVIGAVTIKCHIAATRSKAAWHHSGDKGVLWQPWNLAIEVLPRRTAILGQLKVSIINADPQHTLLRWAFLNGNDLGEAIFAVSARHHSLRHLAAHDRQLVTVKTTCQILGAHPVVTTVL